VNNQPDNERKIVRIKKAKFKDFNDKIEFQELANTVERESKTVDRWLNKYDKTGDILDDLESNYQGKVNKITKGISNINNNDKNDGDS